MAQTRERMRMTLRVILILKQASCRDTRNETLAQKRPRHGDRSSRGGHILLRSTTSGKQKKNCSTSSPQIRNQITPVTMEADQILLVLQQLANNNNSANFHYNINTASKMHKLLTKKDAHV